MFFLGFSSGLPFLLLLSTLSVWLTEVHVSKTQIGLLAWVTLPYALKFIWAPLVIHIRVPILACILGHRRAWLITTQLGLIVALLGLGSTNPEHGLMWTTLWAGLVGFCSALQDVWVESFRIDQLPRERAGIGAGATVLGYRAGMLVSGAGAIFLSTFLPWFWVYSIMACCLLLGVVTTLCSSDPDYSAESQPTAQALPPGRNWFHNSSYHFKQAWLALLQNKSFALILIFIFSFKANDALINTMNVPFLMELGFSKLEVAHVGKTFGISAMAVGGVCASILVTCYGLWRNLVLCVLLQMLSCVFFIIQAWLGSHLGFLFLTMGLENFTCGMCQVMLIVYLTSLCHKPWVTAHFAILSSLASMARVIVSMLAGVLADHTSWDMFYANAMLLSLPAFCLLYIYSEHFDGNQARAVLPSATLDRHA